MRLFVLVLFFAVALGLAPVALAAEPPPEVGAEAAILIETRTGRILYEKEAFRRRPPASTTKMLTAILAVSGSRLDRRIVVSRHAARTIGSKAKIHEGDLFTLGELLKGLLLRSGNDTAMAIAEGLFGSDEAFQRAANALALRLGTLNTHVVNPHGLHASDHFMAARDLAEIGRALLREPELARIVGTKADTFGPLNGHARTITNTNQLLGVFPGADGVKTGTTGPAGKCLVASATRGNLTLLSVVLHSPDRWGESSRLLAWGFKNFSLIEGPRRGDPVGRWRFGPLAVKAVSDRDLAAVVPVGEELRLERRISRNLFLPKAEGAPVGVIALVGPKGTEATALAVLGSPPPLPSRALTGERLVRMIGWLRSRGVLTGIS